ncbi:MAG: nicotinamide riboside transporter PnuC [Prevotella sp.]|nr:nicotinamide riboside transporter PnuC [Prevotella sp.]
MTAYLTSNYLDIAGTFLGLLYLLLEFRESAWMWVAGLVMPAVYIVVLYQKGIYADCGMEVYYFLAGLYGLYYWLRGGRRSGDNAVKICRVRRGMALRLALLALVLWGALALFLARLTDSTVPCVDGFTTSLSAVALWMLSRKHLEQWLVWFVVDLVSVGLYIYKGIYGRAFLYGIYTVMALCGYAVWRKRMHVQVRSIINQ